MKKLTKDSKVVRVENVVQYDTHMFCAVVNGWAQSLTDNVVDAGRAPRAVLRHMVATMVSCGSEPSEIVRETRAFLAHASLVAVDSSISGTTAQVAAAFAELAPRSAQAMLSAAFREIGNFATARTGDKAGEFCPSATKEMLTKRQQNVDKKLASEQAAVAKNTPTSGSLTVSKADDLASLITRVKAGEKFVITYKVKG